MDLIEEEKLGASFEALGGEAFLKTIKIAHKAYGDALGLTKAKKADVALPSLREPLDAFLVALRIDIVRVSAHVDPEHPGSAARAKELLGPVAQWRSASAQAAAAEEVPAAVEAGGDEPAAPAED